MGQTEKTRRVAINDKNNLSIDSFVDAASKNRLLVDTILKDGVAGVNLAGVTTNNELKVYVNGMASGQRQIQIKNTGGTSVDVGYQTGSEVSLPTFIADFTNPTTRATVNVKGTTAVGLNTLGLGIYKATPPTLTDDQVYPLQLDTQGRLIISQTSATRRTIELSYITSSFGIIASNMWRNVLWYTVPASYQFELTQFNSSAGNLLSSARINRVRSLGTYNVGTSTFTDGTAYSSPGFCSSVEAEVTTALTGTAVTFTVTYTNQDGVAGRTGTIVTTAAPVQFSRFLMTLQTGDFGVRDITAVTKSGGTAGIVALYGLTTIMYERISNSDQTFPRFMARESIIVEAGDLISLEVNATSATATTRMVKAVGILSPV